MNKTNILPKKFKEIIKKDKKIIAVFLFGSYVKEEYHRDIDICLVLDKTYSKKEMAKIMIEYSGIVSDKFDVSVFQLLPIYIRNRILKEGKIILCKDENFLYEIAYSTIKEFNLFKKIYHTYLEGVKNEK